MEVSSIGDSLEKQVPRNQYLAFDPIKAPKEEARYALWPKLKIAVPNVPCILLLRHVEHVPSSHSATTNPRNQHGFAVHTPTVRGRLQRFPDPSYPRRCGQNPDKLPTNPDHPASVSIHPR
ncbi:hypothetical protein BC936DRAFT_149360 [Jimgerdemannia flammicorona]|uniref:Uncharacterized protein n=1 Tax=Jimgerdemannia flammicorona TaxID=994334 RepID=A0A433D0Z8_9FUNG|nr:hypothetical protein BC936DRAFT_149360 [Jimgerdemannia flammicorona]